MLTPLRALTFLATSCLLGCSVPFADIELRFNTTGEPTPVATDAAPDFLSEPLFDTIPGKIGSHAPTLTAFPDGELLAAWYSYTGPDELDGSAIYLARRPAGAARWESPALLIDRPQGDGNPVLYSEGDNVWLFQAVVPGGWSTSHIEVQRSSDRGRAWSPPRVISAPLGANVRFPPVRLSDGKLLLPAYDDLLQRAIFLVSADGDAWDLRSVLATPPPHQCIQPSAVTLAGGRLLVVLRNTGQGWLWVSASDDGGRTWSAPADSGFPNPAAPAVLLRLNNGHLALVYNDSRTARRPLSITLSADDGVTWHPARVLVDGPGQYAYPAAVQTPDGLIHIVYSHNRERIQHLTLNEAWIVSRP